MLFMHENADSYDLDKYNHRGKVQPQRHNSSQRHNSATKDKYGQFSHRRTYHAYYMMHVSKIWCISPKSTNNVLLC
jgi:hypothetical protein